MPRVPPCEVSIHPLWPDAAPTWFHPHLLFEVLAYFVGFQLYLRTQRAPGNPVSDFQQRVWLLVSAVLGAAAGSKVLFWIEDPVKTWENLLYPPYWLGGKTIVGALLGGLVAVEAAKWFMGIRRSTGDALVTPLAVGMIIGRLGCFFSGITDGTHGTPTQLPWGMDLGDGIARHPAALYEIGWLALSAAVIVRLPGIPLRDGDRFKLFLSGYLLFRLLAETIKTQPFWAFGLSGIQVACVGCLLYYLPHHLRIVRSYRSFYGKRDI